MLETFNTFSKGQVRSSHNIACYPHMMQLNTLSIPYKCHHVEGPPKWDRGSQSRKARNTEHFARVNFRRILHFPGVNWHFNRVNWHSNGVNRHSNDVNRLFMDVSFHSKQQIDANEMPIDSYKMPNSQKLTPTKCKNLTKLTPTKCSILQGFQLQGLLFCLGGLYT